MSRHKCTKELYKAFLQASSVRYSGLALSEVSPSELSHDGISRWLKENRFSPKDVWTNAKSLINFDEECLLIADDSVLSKTFSKKIDLVNYQYSGNKHDVVAGIGLVNLLWHGCKQDQSVPVDYRIYDKDTDGKTKNTHFCDMLSLAKKRGIHPSAVVMDAWYSSLKNLKAIRDHGWVWVTTLRKNRKVNRDVSLETLDIPDEGLIEVYHRELKQTCGIERCQARTGRAQRNHICLSIMAWLDKHRRRITEHLSLYQQDWEAIKDGISSSIKVIMAAR